MTVARVKGRAQMAERKGRGSELCATLSLTVEHEGERKGLRKALFSFSNSHLSYCQDEKTMKRGHQPKIQMLPVLQRRRLKSAE